MDDAVLEWLLQEIQAERMVIGLIHLKKKDQLGYQEAVGDAEVTAYLMTASLGFPIRDEYAEIYVYLSGKTMLNAKYKTLEELPDFMREKVETGLTDYEKQLMDGLKQDIYQARGGDIRHPLLDALRSLKKNPKNSTGGN